MSEERTYCIVSHVFEEGSRRHVLHYASGSGQTKTICNVKNCEVNLPGGFPGILALQEKFHDHGQAVSADSHEHSYDHGVCWCGHDRNTYPSVKNVSGEFDKAMAELDKGKP